MIVNALFFVAGLIVGWNVFPQPAYVESFYDRVIMRASDWIKRLFPVFLLILVSGCGAGIVPPELGYAKERAMAEIAIASVTSTADPVPDEKPKVGDKCPDCNDPPGACGVGKVGDGRVCDVCRKCGGDGKIDQRDITRSAASAEPSITLYMTPSNRGGWPAEWYSQQRDAFTSAGWSVSVILGPPGSDEDAYLLIVGRDGKPIRRYQSVTPADLDPLL